MTGAIQRELDSFFGKVRGLDYSIHAVTKGALTQARAKLKPGAFTELGNIAVKEFYEGAPYRVWKGHRLLAVDGSTLNLPSHPDTEREFGKMQVGCKASVWRSMARISLCYDVLNLITLDSRMDGFNVPESSLMKEHLGAVTFKEGDLLLTDRGYPSVALMYTLRQKGVHFCLRMKNSWWKEVDAFNRSGRQSAEVVFTLPKKDSALRRQYQGGDGTVRCRLVAVTLDNGEKEILCTSLLDEQEYSTEDLKELYHYRWNIEEAYKLFKCRVQVEVFSGKTANAIRQDFYAKVFMMNMCAVLSFPVEEKVRAENTAAQNNRKHPRQTNRTNALDFCRKAWVAIWLKDKLGQILQAMENVLLKTTDIIRPGRKFERKKLPKTPPCMNYKQL